MTIAPKTTRNPKQTKGDKSEAAFLDAAESEFAEKGYSGSSMRSVADKANANLGAIHYYFGSKEVLVRRMLERVLRPAALECMEKLRACERKSNNTAPDFHLLLKAYIEPMYAIHKINPTFDKTVLRIIDDPAPQVRKLFSQLLDEHTFYFAGLLRRCNPQLSIKEYYWRLNSIYGSLVSLLTRRSELMALIDEEIEFSAEDEDQGLELVIQSLYQLYMAPPVLKEGL
ncbi:MAG: TetR family transcriptional regulator [Gammaproteobacteria bacterium]|jgi:AcrR family transcriptional regulator|nr:TetR family transcriptional regulator [Gammaproteobacteria bacterium]